MEKYDRDEIEESDVPIPFPEDVIGQDSATIEVKIGSRIFNLVEFALTTLGKNLNIVILANGPAITKAVTIVEIIKRRKPQVFQWNKISFKKIKEFWKPTEVGMSRIKVTRELPTMHILLSTIPLDTSIPGVQIPTESKLNKKMKNFRPNKAGTNEVPGGRKCTETKHRRNRKPDKSMSPKDTENTK